MGSLTPHLPKIMASRTSSGRTLHSCNEGSDKSSYYSLPNQTNNANFLDKKNSCDALTPKRRKTIYDKQKSEIPEVLPTPRKSSITTRLNMLSYNKFKSHQEMLILAFDKMVGLIFNEDKLVGYLFELQVSHLRVAGLSKAEFKLMMRCMDEAFLKCLKDRYVGHRRKSMRQFLERIYFSMTFYMPRRGGSVIGAL